MKCLRQTSKWAILIAIDALIGVRLIAIEKMNRRPALVFILNPSWFYGANTFDLNEHDVLEGHSAVVGRLLAGGDAAQIHTAEVLFAGEPRQRCLRVLGCFSSWNDHKETFNGDQPAQCFVYAIIFWISKHVSWKVWPTRTLFLLSLYPLALQLPHIQPLLGVLVSDVFSGRQHLQRVPGWLDIPRGADRALVLHHGWSQPGRSTSVHQYAWKWGLRWWAAIMGFLSLIFLLGTMRTKNGVKVLVDFDSSGNPREFSDTPVELWENFIVQFHDLLHCLLRDCYGGFLETSHWARDRVWNLIDNLARLISGRPSMHLHFMMKEWVGIYTPLLFRRPKKFSNLSSFLSDSMLGLASISIHNKKL